MLSGNHPDLLYVTHEKPASIGVDDIRDQINDTIMIRPYSGNYKIYIVDEAEKMTVQALANAYGVSRTRINVLLNQREVSTVSAGRMASALGVDVTEILENN